MNIIKGKSIEGQMRHVDVILSRMFRRLNKRIVASIPRIPIFGNVIYKQSDGIVLRCITPASGKIIRGHVHIVPNKDVGSKKKFEFTASVTNKLGRVEYHFDVKPGAAFVAMDLTISRGDFVVIKADNPEEITDMVASVIFEIDSSDTITKKYLIEELEKANEGISDDINTEVIDAGPAATSDLPA